MPGSFYNLCVVPILVWLVGLSLALVAYLATLAVKEIRRNHRLNEERQRLGLRPAMRSSWQFLL